MTGDAYGPYDPEFVAEERQRVAREKVRVGTSRLFMRLCDQSLGLAALSADVEAHEQSTYDSDAKAWALLF